MAIFSTDKKEKKSALASRKPRRARQAKLSAGREHEIVRVPWLSEKALIGTERGVYVFAIPEEATKAEVAGAIQAIYKVAPRKVRVARLPGKRKNLRARRGEGQRAAQKKAYVYLKSGDTIELA